MTRNGRVLCSALVLLMTVPGLALFYGGLVRQKNVLSTMLKSLISIGIVTLLWAFVGYSLVFSEGNAFIGGLDFAFLRGGGADSPDRLVDSGGIVGTRPPVGTRRAESEQRPHP